jgi:hypothetical protein
MGNARPPVSTFDSQRATRSEPRAEVRGRSKGGPSATSLEMRASPARIGSSAPRECPTHATSFVRARSSTAITNAGTSRQAQ